MHTPGTGGAADDAHKQQQQQQPPHTPAPPALHAMPSLDSTADTGSPAAAAAPPPPGILLSRHGQNTTPRMNTKRSSILLHALPKEDPSLTHAPVPVPAPLDAPAPAAAGPASIPASSSKLSNLISKFGRSKHTAASHSKSASASASDPAAVDDPSTNTTGTSLSRRKSTDEHLHHHPPNKKAKHTKSRPTSGRHTPVVEGDYGQFLAAEQLRAALEREQAKAAKRAEKDRPLTGTPAAGGGAAGAGGKAGTHTTPSKAAAAVAAAAAASASNNPPPAPEFIKPSHQLPGAFGTLSRASSRSHRVASGSSTPKERKRGSGHATPARAHELRAPNPCGVPIYDSDDNEEDDNTDRDGDEDADATTPVYRTRTEGSRSAVSAVAGAVASVTARHIVHDDEHEDEEGDVVRATKFSKSRMKKLRPTTAESGTNPSTPSTSAQPAAKRKSFFSLSRNSSSANRPPSAVAREEWLTRGEAADRGSEDDDDDSGDESDESIVRTSYALDLAAINTQEMLETRQRSGAAGRSSTSTSSSSAPHRRSTGSSSALAAAAAQAGDDDDYEDEAEGEADLSSTRSLKSWRSHPSASSISETMSDATVVLSKPLLELEEFELDNFIKNFSRHTKEVRVPVAPAATRRMPQWSDFRVPANEAEMAAREGKKVTVLTHVDRGLQAIMQNSAGPVQATTGTGSDGSRHAAASADVDGAAPGPWSSASSSGHGKSSTAAPRSSSGAKDAAMKKEGSSGGASSAADPKADGGGTAHAASTAGQRRNASGGNASAGPAGAGTTASADAPHIKWAPESGAFPPSTSYKKRLGFGHGSGSGSGNLPPIATADDLPPYRLDDAASLDDGWEVVEGVATKHEDGRALLGGVGSDGAGEGAGGEGSGGAGAGAGRKEEEEQVDAVAFVIAYILALVERYAPEELDNGPDDRYREGKLRSHLERLYIIAPFWERFLFGVRALYRWEQPRRTGAAAMIYFVLWYTNLLPTAFMLSLLYYILQFRFFPPSESFLHEQVRKRMARGVEADKFSEQLRRRSRLDLLELYRRWIERFGTASQIAAGDIADFHEKVKNLILWRNPTATWRTFTLLSIATVFVTFASAHLVWKLSFFFLGVTFFILLPLQSHYPRYRRPLSPIWWVLWGSPTDFVWGSSILRERHAKLHGYQVPNSAKGRADKSGGKTAANLYQNLLHLRGVVRHGTSAGGPDLLTAATDPARAIEELARVAERQGKDLDDLQAETALKDAQRGHKLASFFCQHHTVPGHLHVTTRMIYFVALHSTRPTNSRKTCKTELSDIAGLVKTNNFRLLGFHGLKVRKRDGKSMHFSNMSHRDDAFNLILSVTGSVWSKV